MPSIAHSARTGTNANSTTATTLSLNYAHPGGRLVVFVAHGGDGTGTGSQTATVTFNGVTVPLLDSLVSSEGMRNFAFSSAPGAATANIVVTYSAAVRRRAIFALSLSDAGGVVAVAKNSAGNSVSVTTSTGALYLASLGWSHSDDVPTSGSNQTRRLDDDSPTRYLVDSKTADGSFSWSTMTSSTQRAAIGIAVEPAGGGGTPNPPLHELAQDWNDNVLDMNIWTLATGTASVQAANQRLEVKATAPDTERGVTALGYRLADGQRVFVQYALNPATDHTADIRLYYDGGSLLGHRRHNIFRFYDGVVVYGDDTAGWQDRHKWVGFLRSGDNILCQTSSDGISWTTRYTHVGAAGTPKYESAGILLRGNWWPTATISGSTDTIAFDNLNTLGTARTTPATFYVSAAGNDANAGTTTGSPWQTLAKVVSFGASDGFIPGDQIRFRGGDTFPTPATMSVLNLRGTSSNPIVFNSYGTGRATFTSNHRLRFQDAFHLTIENLNWVGIGVGGVLWADAIELRWDNPGGNVTVRNVTASNVLTARGLYIYAQGDGFASNLLVEDCVFHDNQTGMFMYFWGLTGSPTYGRPFQNVTLRRIDAYNNKGQTVAELGGSASTGFGVTLIGVDGGLMEHCRAWNNGERVDTPSGPVGIYTQSCDNGVVQFCESHNNKTANQDGSGFDIGGNSRDCITQYCYSHDNAGPGLYMGFGSAGLAARNQFRYCVSQRDGRVDVKLPVASIWRGINAATDPPEDNMWLGCTIFVDGAVMASPSTGAIGTYATTGSEGRPTLRTRFYNNIIVVTGNARLVRVHNAQTDFRLQGNTYHVVSGTRQYHYNGTNYSTLSAFRAAGTNIEKLGGGDVGTELDPLLTNPGGGGTVGTTQPWNLPAYELQAASPMPTAGVNLRPIITLPSRDFYDNAIPGSGDFVAVGADTIADPGGPDPAPAAPTSVTVALQGETTVRLSWTHAGTYVTDFEIQRSINGGAYGAATIEGSAVRQWDDVSRTPGTSYRYRIRARGNMGNSAYVESATVQVPVSQTILTPVLVVWEPTPGTGRINNTNTPDPNADDWEIERNGVVIGTTTTWPYDDHPGNGTHTYRARGRRL
jgi:hypothetical protein